MKIYKYNYLILFELKDSSLEPEPIYPTYGYVNPLSGNTRKASWEEDLMLRLIAEEDVIVEEIPYEKIEEYVIELKLLGEI